ncbi:MAG TPA: YabP/YqfC family sporulation protein [Candidatus Fimimonas merdipullorum]|uniref:YabP/YqfC family sporulation protein n=1 Tax=Candidatus Fimimonas merdipullorum TaxID=2840822 RepID=A0A9D1SPA1_9BACT|nr:YabP/YqfC family sporulation protein [Candidatus Fimimonas merdipullorum]
MNFGFADNLLTVNGVTKVEEVCDKEARLKTADGVLCVKGAGLNVTRLDRESGVVQLECKNLFSLALREKGGIKGLFG